MSFSFAREGDHGSELFPCIQNGISQWQQTLGTNTFRTFIYVMTTIDQQNISFNEGDHLEGLPRQ